MCKKQVCYILIFIFILPIRVYSATEKPVYFDDIFPTPYYYDITYLYNEGLISGNGEGKFFPEHLMTKAEFTSLVSRMDKLEQELKGEDAYDTILMKSEAEEITINRLMRYGIKPKDWYYEAYYNTNRRKFYTLTFYEDYTIFDPNEPILGVDAFIIAMTNKWRFNDMQYVSRIFIDLNDEIDAYKNEPEIYDAIKYSWRRIATYTDQFDYDIVFDFLEKVYNHKSVEEKLSYFRKGAEPITRGKAAFLIKNIWELKKSKLQKG